MTGPEDGMPGGAAGHGRLRASNHDREHAVEVLKGAFVHGQLAKDEFDLRMGQALAAQTFAELAALTADLPAGLIKVTRGPKTAHAPTRAPVSKVVTMSTCVVIASAMLGLLAGGIAFTLLSPAAFRSSTVVVLPANTQGMLTQVVIADSNPVLAGAQRNLSPHVSLQTLLDRVQVRRLTANALSISAEGRTAEEAADMANAVASSYVAYINSPIAPGGRVSARILEPGRRAAATSLPAWLLVPGALGALFGALIGAAGALAFISVWQHGLRFTQTGADQSA